jgi:hypothetical protein
MRNPAVAALQRTRMRKYTDQELIMLLAVQAARLGRTPSTREVTPHEATYRARFGSYNNAVALAGLTPNITLPPHYLVDGRGSVRLSLRFQVLKRDSFRCQYCGGTPNDGYVLQIDHKVPVSKGGETVLENLITACSLCNLGKSDSPL